MLKRAICMLLTLGLLLGSFALAEEKVLDLRGKKFSGVEDVCKALDGRACGDIKYLLLGTVENRCHIAFCGVSHLIYLTCNRDNFSECRFIPYDFCIVKNV